jgi:hypothetical protein
MTGNNDDRDLRARFAALRQEEEAQAPRFALPATRAVRRRRTPGLIPVAECALAIAAAIFVLRFVALEPRRPSAPVASLTEWRAPTDFLLETPGRELLRTVPALGGWSDSTQVPTTRPKHPQVRKKVQP